MPVHRFDETSVLTSSVPKTLREVFCGSSGENCADAMLLRRLSMGGRDGIIFMQIVHVHYLQSHVSLEPTLFVLYVESH